MFDYTHYVPILRWKRAEWDALRHLTKEQCRLMTPLFEVTPKSFMNRKAESEKVKSNCLRNTGDDILQYWGQDPIFVDTWLLPADQRGQNGMHPIALYAKEARERQLTMIPVMNLHVDDSYKVAVGFANNADGNGICFRLFPDDLNNPLLVKELTQLLKHFGVLPGVIDLLIDLRLIQEPYPSISEICNTLPFLSEWRTFTLVGGAFPENLSHLPKNDQYEIDRSDWCNWRDQAMGLAHVARIPTFGDYTIQHPIFAEAPEHANISASIRYTSSDYWVIIRGEGLQNEDGPGYEQYRANAQLLLERDEYCGAEFSYGDDYIAKLSRGENGTGNPETLIRAGINHHLTFVVNQLSNLFVPVTVNRHARGATLD